MWNVFLNCETQELAYAATIWVFSMSTQKIVYLSAWVQQPNKKLFILMMCTKKKCAQ